MPDATYVGAGMPCGNCGNPLTPGQPHKCGRVGNPYAPSADWKPGQDTFTAQAAGIWDEGFAAGRAALPDPRWEDIADRMATPLDFRRQQEAHGSDCVCAMCVVLRDYIAAKSSPPAALPDERLREALELIRAHARLDLTERGIAEAERYAVIADDALTGSDLLASSTAEKLAEPEPHESERIAEWAAREAEPNPYRSQDQIVRDEERTRILALLDSVEAEEAVVNALMAAVDAGADLGSEARAAITALVGLVERVVPNG